MLKLELPNDIQTRLELLSLSTGISIHFFALEAILEYLDDIESRHQAPSEGHGQSGMGEVAALA
jgi:predicted DNA-binding protein